MKLSDRQPQRSCGWLFAAAPGWGCRKGGHGRNLTRNITLIARERKQGDRKASNARSRTPDCRVRVQSHERHPTLLEIPVGSITEKLDRVM